MGDPSRVTILNLVLHEDWCAELRVVFQLVLEGLAYLVTALGKTQI